MRIKLHIFTRVNRILIDCIFGHELNLIGQYTPKNIILSVLQTFTIMLIYIMQVHADSLQTLSEIIHLIIVQLKLNRKIVD